MLVFVQQILFHYIVAHFKLKLQTMKNSVMVLFVATVIITSCNEKTEIPENPFFSEYTTPFQTPPFDLIDTTHYIPAFEKGMNDQNKIIVLGSQYDYVFDMPGHLEKSLQSGFVNNLTCTLKS